MEGPSHALTPSMYQCHEQDDLPKQLYGSGASRQTRRLHLRNQGFRAAAIPTRKVTPKSTPSSNWFAISGMENSSDVENVSPSGMRAGSQSGERRKCSGILLEVGNATLSRRNGPRPRTNSDKACGPHTPGDFDNILAGSPTSPPPPTATIRPRSVKTRAKINQKRRSVSAQASKYIEHLEAELASTQLQLSSITSPSVTREHTTRMRTLNMETKQLQDEVAEWEAKYEQRVQEEVDRLNEIEVGLRSRIRTLEKNAEDSRLTIQELESQVESTTQSVEAVEAANVNLEKRLEIMSELLAASPTKIDLHAKNIGLRRRHVRPKSMLPRFPTASSLVASPDRQPQTQPTSPMMAFTEADSSNLDSPIRAQFATDILLSHVDATSDAGSVFSEAEASSNGEGWPSADTLSHFNPWTLQARDSAKARPARRMRRFGAGSTRPKSLILPSTSYYEQIPASAPLLERSETTPAFPFPHVVDSCVHDDSPSSRVSRRRASTMATETIFGNIAASPFMKLREPSDVTEESMKSVDCPPLATSQMTASNLSSFDTNAGRNLMEELTAAGSVGSYEATDRSKDSEEELPRTPPEVNIMYPPDRILEHVPQDTQLILVEETSSSPQSIFDSYSTMTALHRRRHSRTGSISIDHAVSAWERLHILFSDMWRSPVALARHVVQSAQARMRLPEPLQNVQWWLVGVLLGPMAKRRLLSRSACREDLENQPLLQAYISPTDEDRPLAYGTLYHTPLASPRRAKMRSARSEKRAKNKHCIHQSSTHSPWLWLKFSITLAFAVGVAFKEGPGSLLKATVCACRRSNVREDKPHRRTSGSLC